MKFPHLEKFVELMKGGGCLVGVDGLGCVLVRGGVCSGVGRSWVGWGWWWGRVRVVE